MIKEERDLLQQRIEKFDQLEEIINDLTSVQKRCTQYIRVIHKESTDCEGLDRVQRGLRELGIYPSIPSSLRVTIVQSILDTVEEELETLKNTINNC